ncbi:MAG TPA: SAM-dependent methyltransferase [Spirochaetia bacterium]|nr:SAM-dependent methyltransferase [Spirochaetia bacterium]
MQELEQLIVETIRRQGPLTFARYMETALYYPDLGYYMKDREQFGEEGDFVTAPNLSPLLGRALAETVYDAWCALGRGQLRLVEYGPGRGEMMRDILGYLAAEYPELYDGLAAVLVEVSPALAACQRRTLASVPGEPGKVTWGDVPDDRRDTVVLANEFVDALPFHRVRMGSGGLVELYVGEKDGRLIWVEGSPSSPAVAGFLTQSGLVLPEGHCAEVCLAAGEWLDETARWVDRGFLLVVDYGMEAVSLFSPARAGGTVRSFRRHQLVEDPLVDPGQQDITAHVNFSALANRGREAFGQPAGYTTQGRFIMHAGILEKLAKGDSYVFDPSRHQLAEQLKMLTLPGGMGEIFKVMAFYRGEGPVPALRGMAGGSWPV